MKSFVYLSVFTLLIFTLSAFTIQDAYATTFTAVQSGNWDDPATWGLAEDPFSNTTHITPDITIVIPAGVTVTINNNISIYSGGTINNSGAIHRGTLNNNSGGTLNNNSGGTLNS
ncbi:MAG: hypothetical protein HW420_1549, partial [Candidatus Nitrosotenuis sp.]|nr:hypothetical protein [Candidatus Nitrosotenuis sp.]